MFEAGAINTTATAFVAGVLSGLHCVGMCGPLACSVCAGCGENARYTAAAGYHTSRLLAYSVAGAVAGACGALPMGWLVDSPPAFLPWVFLGIFVFIALGLDKFVKLAPGSSGLLMKAKLAIFSRPRWQGGLMLGALTPLIPCALLFMLWAACLMSGSPWRGAELALSFGCGTVPALLLLQGGISFAENKISPASIRTLQRTIAMLAVMVLLWRLRGAFGFETEGGFLCH